MVHACVRGGVSMMQSEVFLSNTVRLLASLIQLQSKCHALQPHLSNLQLNISKEVSGVLVKEEDAEVRVGVANTYVRLRMPLRHLYLSFVIELKCDD